MNDSEVLHGDPFFDPMSTIPAWDVWRGRDPDYVGKSVVFAPPISAQKKVMNVLASGFPEVSAQSLPFAAYSVAQLQLRAKIAKEEVINALHAAGDSIIKRTRSGNTERGTVEYALRARIPGSLLPGWTLGFGSRGN